MHPAPCAERIHVLVAAIIKTATMEHERDRMRRGDDLAKLGAGVWRGVLL